ncbi:MAG TPA: MBL fold metallo-hydrolase [Solirubrobacterales bacterium]|nr:MBL fold metallo-hydrolase [Solirubrobacterales bacterium]
MNLERTESEGWLSNAYLIDDGEGTGVLIDGNGVAAPLLEAIDRRGLRVPAVLLTHHHVDHVVLDDYQDLGAEIYAHPLTAGELPGVVTTPLADREIVDFGGLSIECLHTPGHAHGHLSFLVDQTDVFTADVLFRGTVGGTRAPQATGLSDLRGSLERLLALPPTTRVHPGHREPTTIGEEVETNPFVSALLGDATPDGVPCTVGGEAAELLLWGPDYDGTNKAWVRFAADGEEAIVGGSQVER